MRKAASVILAMLVAVVWTGGVMAAEPAGTVRRKAHDKIPSFKPR